MKPETALSSEQVSQQAKRLPRAFRIRVTGVSMLSSGQRGLSAVETLVREMADGCGMTVFECAIGRTFLPVYARSGNPTAAVEAVVFDASDPQLRPMLEREGVEGLPAVEAKRTEEGWMFVLPGSGEVVRV